METAKDVVRRLLDSLPDDATYDDIQYHVYVRQKIEQGLAAAERGDVISHEDARRRLARWLDGPGSNVTGTISPESPR